MTPPFSLLYAAIKRTNRNPIIEKEANEQHVIALSHIPYQPDIMKIIVLLSVLPIATAVGPFVPFPYEPFGIYKQRHAEEVEEMKKVIQTSNKKKDPVVVETPNMLDDYEEAQEALFHAIENAEKKVMKVAKKAEHAVEHAIHDEVDNIFHEMPHHEKIERVKKAKDIVETGEKTVKKVERCWPENLKESLEECLAGDIE